MNEELIRKYAKLMKELELTALEIKDENTSVRLEMNYTAGVVKAAASQVLGNVNVSHNTEQAEPDYDKVTSPMIGVFYEAPAENAEPFVKVGDRVKQGDTLCIIEAMKLMNEVTAERDGVIQEVCVKNGDTVEFGTVLFLIGD